MLWEFNVYVAVCLVNLGHESECDYYFNRSRGEMHKVRGLNIMKSATLRNHSEVFPK